MENKAELIEGLAIAMGQGEALKTRYDLNKYDSTTGTMYCNGHIISSSTINNAKNFFDAQRRKYKEHIEELQGAYDMMCFYEVALEGIEKLQAEAFKTGGRIKAGV
ncbi:MAG: hypothetical protein K6B41_03860 [Butyrivibrio sp.]|nr:hypothetical protein [Butyrivibrio sp.]